MSQDDIKAIRSRMRELEKRNEDLQRQAKVLQNDLIEILRILEKLSSTRSTRSNADSAEEPSVQSTPSSSKGTQRKAEVVGYGAVRDPDGNLHTFTGGSLAVL